MCPGGEIVAAATEAGGVVVNGMSNMARNGKNSNSAIAVTVNREDYGGGVENAVEDDQPRFLVQLIFFLTSFGNFNNADEILGSNSLGRNIMPYIRHKTTSCFSDNLSILYNKQLMFSIGLENCL